MILSWSEWYTRQIVLCRHPTTKTPSFPHCFLPIELNNLHCNANRQLPQVIEETNVKNNDITLKEIRHMVASYILLKSTKCLIQMKADQLHCICRIISHCRLPMNKYVAIMKQLLILIGSMIEQCKYTW